MSRRKSPVKTRKSPAKKSPVRRTRKSPTKKSPVRRKSPIRTRKVSQKGGDSNKYVIIFTGYEDEYNPRGSDMCSTYKVGIFNNLEDAIDIIPKTKWRFLQDGPGDSVELSPDKMDEFVNQFTDEEKKQLQSSGIDFKKYDDPNELNNVIPDEFKIKLAERGFYDDYLEDGEYVQRRFGYEIYEEDPNSNFMRKLTDDEIAYAPGGIEYKKALKSFQALKF